MSSSEKFQTQIVLKHNSVFYLQIDLKSARQYDKVLIRLILTVLHVRLKFDIFTLLIYLFLSECRNMQLVALMTQGPLKDSPSLDVQEERSGDWMRRNWFSIGAICWSILALLPF